MRTNPDPSRTKLHVPSTSRTRPNTPGAKPHLLTERNAWRTGIAAAALTVVAAALAPASFLAGCVAGDYSVSAAGGAAGQDPGRVPSGMSVSLTPTSPPTFPASLTAPADGDALSAASNNGPDQSLLDGVTAARMMLYNGLSMKPRLRSVDGSTVVMGGVPAMVVTTGGVWTTKGPVAAQTFVAGDIDVGGAFLASTAYYMYLKLSGGVVTRVISTTAPDAYNRYRTDSTDYAYVGSFTVSATPLVNAFAAHGGVYRYAAGSGVTGLAIAASGVTSNTTKNLRTDIVAVPASSTQAILSILDSYSTQNNPVLFRIGPNDGTHADGYQMTYELKGLYTDQAAGNQNNVDVGVAFHCELDASQNVKYNASSANNHITLAVVGYVED